MESNILNVAVNINRLIRIQAIELPLIRKD